MKLTSQAVVALYSIELTSQVAGKPEQSQRNVRNL